MNGDATTANVEPRWRVAGCHLADDLVRIRGRNSDLIVAMDKRRVVRCGEHSCGQQARGDDDAVEDAHVCCLVQ